ncbi:MAG: hypothetical protein QOD81_1843 [Solirubrobacteraceae bacterium]|jgi:plastocyanin|nr:hypothetical protein [Solirubrobacteraceae bacterium]
MRRIRTYLLAPLVALLVVAVAASAVAATKSVSVRKVGSGFRFAPASLSIKKGDTVRWSWRGSVPHNVKGPGFQSKTAPKLTYSRRFTRAGTYRVVCTIHQSLGQRMTITVR